MINTGRTFGALIGINGNALQFAGIIQMLFTLILGPLLGILVDKKRWPNNFENCFFYMHITFNSFDFFYGK